MEELDELFSSWVKFRTTDHNTTQFTLKKARAAIQRSKSVGWSWVSDGLIDEKKKWFIADILEKMSIPKVMFREILYASIMVNDPSANRKFIEPCVRSFGALRVLYGILHFLEKGTNREKAGAISVLYWVQARPDKKIPNEIYAKIRCWKLKEFVNNEDLALRQQIIPMLNLDHKYYPEELHNLIPQAIQIAREHSDDYIRHRIEIQLGGKGPYKPPPNLK